MFKVGDRVKNITSGKTGTIRGKSQFQMFKDWWVVAYDDGDSDRHLDKHLELCTPHKYTITQGTYAFANCVGQAFNYEQLEDRAVAEKIVDTTPKKCECGSMYVGSPRHSGWCPKYDGSY